MYSVSVRDQETYYLRILLLHVRGARSYDDIRTVDGVLCNSFLQACQLRNLLADDVEWQRALREASLCDMPYQMRNMFAYMLIFCEITDKIALWNEFREYFIEDFIRRGVGDNIDLKKYLRNQFRGDAELWYDLVTENFDNFDQFSRLFLNYYWGNQTQAKIRENLFNGKYRETYGTTREKYAMRKYSTARQLDPPMNEIIQHIARHFETEICDVITIQEISDLERLLTYLRRIDDLRQTRRRFTDNNWREGGRTYHNNGRENNTTTKPDYDKNKNNYRNNFQNNYRRDDNRNNYRTRYNENSRPREDNNRRRYENEDRKDNKEYRETRYTNNINRSPNRNEISQDNFTRARTKKKEGK